MKSNFVNRETVTWRQMLDKHISTSSATHCAARSRWIRNWDSRFSWASLNTHKRLEQSWVPSNFQVMEQLSEPDGKFSLFINSFENNGKEFEPFGVLASNFRFTFPISVSTLHHGCTQVRFWIQFKIPTEYVRLMPRLPENVKIKIPQVGSLTNKS